VESELGTQIAVILPLPYDKQQEPKIMILNKK